MSTKTQENLKAAFAGESQPRKRPNDVRCAERSNPRFTWQ